MKYNCRPILIHYLFNCIHLSTGHGCNQSCGANSGVVHYRDKERIVQLKHFTPLYLTVSAVRDSTATLLDARPILQSHNGTPRNGAVSNNGNGALSNGSTRKEHPMVAQMSSADLSNGYSFDRTESNDDFDASVLASKSSGSVTKYSMRTTRGSGVLSRKPSKEEGYDEPGQFGMSHMNQNENMFTISGHAVEINTIGLSHMEAPQVDLKDGQFQFEIGDDGQVYECHYV